MTKLKLAMIAAGLLAAVPALAQSTPGNTQNRGPEGTGNFVSGTAGNTQKTGPEGTGNFVSGTAGNTQNTGPEGTGNFVNGKPKAK